MKKCKMKKNIAIFISSILLILVIWGVTSLFHGLTSSKNSDISVTVEGLKIKYVNGNSIEGFKLMPSNNKEAGVLKEVSVVLDSDQVITPTPSLSLFLELTSFPSALADASFKWQIYRNDETEYLATGDFEGKTQGDTIELILNELVTSTINTYKIYLWIDANMENDSSMQEQNFTFTLRAVGRAQALVSNYELEGMIYHEDGSVCKLCDVTILPENINTKTTESGYYYFKEVPTGIHTLVVKDKEEIINDKIIIENSSITSVDGNTISLESSSALMIRSGSAKKIASLTFQNKDTLIVRKQEVFNYEYNTNLDIQKLFTFDSIIINGGTIVCYNGEDVITNINQLSNGNHKIRCVATSKTKVTQTSTVTVNINSPKLSISAKQKEFNILTFTNKESTEFFNIGDKHTGDKIICRANGKLVSNINKLNNGRYELTCTITSGNKSASASTIINLDNTTPTIIKKNDTNNIITGISIEPISLFNVNEFSYTSGTTTCMIGENEITNLNTLSDGTYNLSCTRKTGAGKTASASTTVNLDNLEPVIIAKNTANNLITGTSMLVTEFFNIGEYSYTGGITKCEVNDNVITNISGLNDGTYTLTCTMTTGNNKKTSASTIINLDNTTPTITKKNDTNNIITGTSIEPISLFNVNEFSYTSGTTTCMIGENEITNLNTLSDGTYNLYCTRKTGAGKTASDSTTIKLDNLTPVISPKESSYNEYLGASKNSTIYFNIGEYSYTGGTTVCKINSDVINNISSLSLGTYTLTCTMTTGNGKNASASTNLTISEPPRLTEEIISLQSIKPTQIMEIDQLATVQTTANTEYRFYGATPDNYIYYNCQDTDNLGNAYGTTDYNYASSCEKWRVIGVFETETPTDSTNTTFTKENRVKIIRDDILPGGVNSDTSPSGYVWDSSDSNINNGAGVNAWQQADLNRLLNDTYYNKTSSNTCYIGDYNAYKTCDFTTNGLSTTAKNLVEPAKYYLGGNRTNKAKSKEHYIAERGIETKACSSGMGYCNENVERKTNWAGVIGLIYPSDYGYASGSVCADEKNLDEYYLGCQTQNWLYKNNTWQWTITPYLRETYSTYVFRISDIGNAEGSFETFNIGARPTMYLKTEVKVFDGDGTINNPWKIKL